MAEINDMHSSGNAAAVAEPSRGFSVYKPGQGYFTRSGTVVGCAVLGLLGIDWLWEGMKGIKLGAPDTALGAVNPLYVATAGAILVGGVITFFVYYLVFVKPRSVDFLIATESEMKKVNWSTRREVIGSTSAVIVTAAVISIFCYGIDRVFFWFFAQIKVLDI